MPDQYPHPDPGYLRDLAMRDPIAHRQCVRGWRNGYVAATVSALLLFIWRHIKRWFDARPQPRRSH